ncbi:MAG TPA: Nif3-like dinuclear metal center hexameric protein [Treponemataceae bacterium]|nr:Nif3-like dinuclear metal center hexameric protein [Treponemataceae bacterium]
MTTVELDRWFKDLLKPDAFLASDPSLNGIQVDNDGADVRRVAFAVDACEETILRAAELGAGMLFVHHGLFWKVPLALRGSHYRRVKSLLDANLALYASHLPLDAHPEVGNNAGIARALGIGEIEPFGEWRGSVIGCRGEFPKALGIDEAIARLFPDGRQPAHILPFGPKAIRSVGIVSGGASDEVHEAIALGLDLYITGEFEHEAYHPAMEAGINVIAGGHYQTETFGVRLVAERLARETGIDAVFVDVPTGL